MSSTLKELLIESSQLEDQLVATAGELTEELEQSLMLLEIKIPEKVSRTMGLIDRLEMEADNLYSKAQKYLMAQKALSGLRERLLANVKHNMITNNLDSLKGTDESFTLTEGKKTVIISDYSALPKSYNPETITSQPDKEKIRQAIERGEVVPGATLQSSFVLRRKINKGNK